MGIYTKSASWAAAMLVLALANRLGWVADANATTLFAAIPALWVATSRSSHCSRLGGQA